MSDAWSPGGQCYGVVVAALEAASANLPEDAKASDEDTFSHWSGDPAEAPTRDRLFSLSMLSAPSRFGTSRLAGCKELMVGLQLAVQYTFQPPDAGEPTEAWEARMMGDAEILEDALYQLHSTSLSPQPGQVTDVTVTGPPAVLYVGRACAVVLDFNITYSRV